MQEVWLPPVVKECDFFNELLHGGRLPGLSRLKMRLMMFNRMSCQIADTVNGSCLGKPENAAQPAEILLLLKH